MWFDLAAAAFAVWVIVSLVSIRRALRRVEATANARWALADAKEMGAELLRAKQ